MLLELNKEFNIVDIFAYADDIAICLCSTNQLRNIKTIELEFKSRHTNNYDY